VAAPMKTMTVHFAFPDALPVVMSGGMSPSTNAVTLN